MWQGLDDRSGMTYSLNLPQEAWKQKQQTNNSYRTQSITQSAVRLPMTSRRCQHLETSEIKWWTTQLNFTQSKKRMDELPSWPFKAAIPTLLEYVPIKWNNHVLVEPLLWPVWLKSTWRGMKRWNYTVSPKKEKKKSEKYQNYYFFLCFPLLVTHPAKSQINLSAPAAVPISKLETTKENEKGRKESSEILILHILKAKITSIGLPRGQIIRHAERVATLVWIWHVILPCPPPLPSSFPAPSLWGQLWLRGRAPTNRKIRSNILNTKLYL